VPRGIELSVKKKKVIQSEMTDHSTESRFLGSHQHRKKTKQNQSESMVKIKTPILQETKKRNLQQLQEKRNHNTNSLEYIPHRGGI